jgi:hypothetical protein
VNRAARTIWLLELVAETLAWEVSRTRAVWQQQQQQRRGQSQHALETISATAGQATSHDEADQANVRLHVDRRSLDVTSHPLHARSDGTPSLTSRTAN